MRTEAPREQELFGLLLCPQGLQQCQAHRKHSIHLCGLNEFKIAAIFCLYSSFHLNCFSIFVFEHVNHETIGSGATNPIHSPHVALVKINRKEMSSPGRQQYRFPAEFQNLSNRIVQITTRQTTPGQGNQSRCNDSSGLIINLKSLAGQLSVGLEQDIKIV